MLAEVGSFSTWVAAFLAAILSCVGGGRELSGSERMAFFCLYSVTSCCKILGFQNKPFSLKLLLSEHFLTATEQ